VCGVSVRCCSVFVCAEETCGVDFEGVFAALDCWTFLAAFARISGGIGLAGGAALVGVDCTNLVGVWGNFGVCYWLAFGCG